MNRTWRVRINLEFQTGIWSMESLKAALEAPVHDILSTLKSRIGSVEGDELSWSVVELQSDPLSIADVEDFIRDAIWSGRIKLCDLPRLIAQSGFKDPVAFEQQMAAQVGQSKRTTTPAPPMLDLLLLTIAKEHFRVSTLETRKSDSLDFRDVAVWQIRSALEAAFNAGMVHQEAQRSGSGTVTSAASKNCATAVGLSSIVI